MNAPPMVEVGGEVDPLKIAQKELNDRKVGRPKAILMMIYCSDACSYHYLVLTIAYLYQFQNPHMFCPSLHQ